MDAITMTAHRTLSGQVEISMSTDDAEALRQMCRVVINLAPDATDQLRASACEILLVLSHSTIDAETQRVRVNATN